LLPFPSDDLAERPELGLPAWPVGYCELMRYLSEVERLFGLAPGPYEARLPPDVAARAGSAPAFVAREAKWPAFKRRNVAALLRKDIESKALTVWLGATVCDFALATESGRVAALTARGNGLHPLRVAARRFVIAAGAIESTRLLLLLERAGGHMDGRSRLGRAFQDHLSAPLATVETDDPRALNRLAGFRFEGSMMRSLRFDFAPSARRAAGAPAGFVHIAPHPLQPTGFHAVREFVRSIQRARPDPWAAARILSDAPYLAKLSAWRYGRRQLYWPRPSLYEVHCVVEQTPHENNCITLSERLDTFGQPLARINWQVNEADANAFRVLSGAFNAYWNKGLSPYGRLVWRVAPHALGIADLSEAGDIYHPVGTTTMGRNPDEGVVDGDLRVFGVPNVFVAATSTFPAGGTSNPTMMLAMFVLRLADRLKAEREPS